MRSGDPFPSPPVTPGSGGVPARPGLFTLTTLGRFQLVGPHGSVDLGRGKLCGLVALLACRGPMAREQLSELLWGSHFDAQAQQNLRGALARLRRLIGPDAFEATEGSLAFRAGTVSCDLIRFEALVRDGGRPALREAVDLYRGRFLIDVAIRQEGWAEWADAERSRVETLAVDALVGLAAHELAAGAPEDSLAASGRALAIDELREDAHRALMAALAATGRRAEALRHFDGLASLLARALAVEPDAATRSLVESIRRDAGESRPVGDLVAAPAAPPPLLRIAAQSVAGEGRALLAAAPNGGDRQAADREALARVCERVARGHEGSFVGARERTLVFEFPSARAAASAGLAVMDMLQPAGGGRPAARIGLHALDPFTSDSVTIGADIETAERLSGLAGRGEIVASEAARERLSSALDAAIEDLGQRGDGPSDPLRAFRISPLGVAERPSRPRDGGGRLWPTVAVIPFTTVSDDPRRQVLGEILADEIIAGLSHTGELTVISRLSTTALRGRDVPLSDVRSLLGATYVLSGACHVLGDDLRLVVEFTDARSEEVVWADRLVATVGDVVASGGVVDALIARLRAGVMSSEGLRARTAPMPTLANSTLLIGAVTLMHQLSRPSLDLARAMLEELVGRMPGHPMPHAWLAHLFILRASQGWSDSLEAEAVRAGDSAQRALDADPTCSLALAIDGHVQTHFMRRFDLALDRFDLAVGVNPNDSLAWLLKSATHAFMGAGALAVSGADRALRVSPLDPRRWYYDSLGATAALAAGQYDRAVELARQSLKGNRTHTSTWRAMAIAQSLAGQEEEARRTVGELLALQPGFTVSQYRARHPACAFETGQIWADALTRAGAPA